MDFSSPNAAPVFRKMRRASGGLTPQIAEIRDYLWKNRKMYGIAALVLFGFYWFQLRPIQINHSCGEQASANAKLLLVNKIGLTADTAQRATYQDMADKGMYLRTDYESFYTKCLRNYGIN